MSALGRGLVDRSAWVIFWLWTVWAGAARINMSRNHGGLRNRTSRGGCGLRFCSSPKSTGDANVLVLGPPCEGQRQGQLFPSLNWAHICQQKSLAAHTQSPTHHPGWSVAQADHRF